MSTTFIEEFDEFGNVKSVANIQFTDTILGEGSFGTVRLAKRSSKMPLMLSNSHAEDDTTDENIRCSDKSLGSSFHSEGDIWNHDNDDNNNKNKNRFVTRNRSRIFGSIIAGNEDFLTSALHDNEEEEEEIDKDEEIVAVKIYSKFVLKKMRDVTRSSRNLRRMSIHDALEKVEKEIAIMKLMDHPNLVKLYEVIDSNETDTLYIVLEYLPLGPIMKFDLERMKYFQNNTQFQGLTKDECYNEQYTALYFVDILHGLGFLHQHHICHRDMKPENILVDARGYAKISDFGVSHIFEDEVDFDESHKWSRMSHIGNLTKREGTYSFWSPEMCNGKSASFSGYASDLWACGICLHIFASGKLPFYANDPTELFSLIIKSEIPKNAKFTKSLNNLIALLLEKDPDDRISIGEALEHPFCQQARAERMTARGPEILQKRLKNLDRKSIFNKSCAIQ